MGIVETYGPLIDAGEIDGASYEVRGDAHPMVYVYVKIGKRYVEKSTQQGEMSGAEVAGMLASELGRGV